MFSGARNFNQSLNWDTRNVTKKEYMFDGCPGELRRRRAKAN